MFHKKKLDNTVNFKMSLRFHNFIFTKSLHNKIFSCFWLAGDKLLLINNNSKRNMSNRVFERLPKTIVPKNYSIKLAPNLDLFTFDGENSIKIQITTPTDKIILHSLDLVIRKATLLLENGNEINPTDIILSKEDETATLMFENKLLNGNGLLSFEFSGELNDKMKGFYRCKYFTTAGEERFAGVTQFEATDCRRCFPCWDEPAIKATFDISLIVPYDRVALSNMPIKNESKTVDNLRLVNFETTPIMSTYLVCCVVGEYDYVEDTSADGVLVRVYTPLGKKNQGLFALEVATKVLPYYKEYFNIAYPLPKMDLIAISDFSAGAMENWGLVTYRETFLLVDPENTSLIRKQSIALTIGHEIAHQWFGNLVTMEWWSWLWLNEGYASFVEFLCVDHLFPEFDIWTQFVTDMYTRALELDCLKNSHPIQVTVGHPSEIDEIFDEICYNKGASVIRMLHHYIGEDDFRKGMNIYLSQHQYKNTISEDLWEALEKASNKPVGAVMSTWIKQMGFPVVKVKSEQQDNKRKIILEQEKFCADGSIQTDGNYFWMIPITISTSKSPNKIVYNTVLDKKSMEIILDDITAKDWIKINPGTIGYYRTAYPSEMIDNFIPSIKDQSLPALDRLGLLDDLFALVQSSQSPTVDVLRLIDAYRNETNYTVWSSITNCLMKLQILLSHTDFNESFDSFGCRLYKPIADSLGWDAKTGESHLDTLLRSLVLNRLVSFNCPETIKHATEIFNQSSTNISAIPADLRSVCYKAALKNVDDSIFDKMLTLYRGTDLHEEKDRISRALGSTETISLLRVIEFAMSDEVRAQDSVFVIVAVAMNPKGRDMTWQFFKDNWEKLLNQYEGGFLLSRLVKYLTENFASEKRAQEVTDFFAEHQFPGTERTVQQSIETIRLNANWLKRDVDSIKEFLTKQ